MVQMGKDGGNGAPGSMDRHQKLKVAVQKQPWSQNHWKTPMLKVEKQQKHCRQTENKKNHSQEPQTFFLTKPVRKIMIITNKKNRSPGKERENEVEKNRNKTPDLATDSLGLHLLCLYSFFSGLIIHPTTTTPTPLAQMQVPLETLFRIPVTSLK